MLSLGIESKITYELSYCFNCKNRDRISVMSSRQAQTSVSIKRMPAKILIGSCESIYDLQRDEKDVAWVKWKEVHFLVASSFSAKSSEARCKCHQKRRYAFKRSLDRGIEAVIHFGHAFHHICIWVYSIKLLSRAFSRWTMSMRGCWVLWDNSEGVSVVQRDAVAFRRARETWGWRKALGSSNYFYYHNYLTYAYLYTLSYPLRGQGSEKTQSSIWLQ